MHDHRCSTMVEQHTQAQHHRSMPPTACRQALARGDDDSVKAAEKSIMVELLRAQFGEASLDEDSDNIYIRIPGNAVTVDWNTGKVTTEPEDGSLQARVEMCLQRLQTALMRLEPTATSSHTTGTALVTE